MIIFYEYFIPAIGTLEISWIRRIKKLFEFYYLGLYLFTNSKTFTETIWMTRSIKKYKK